MPAGLSSLKPRMLRIGIGFYVEHQLGRSKVSSNFSQCLRFPTMWYVRPAKPQISLQSDQSLCWSLEYFMIVKLLTEHLEFLSIKGGCRGSSESTHVKMPHCWKSHALAQILYTQYEASQFFFTFFFFSSETSLLYVGDRVGHAFQLSCQFH